MVQSVVSFLGHVKIESKRSTMHIVLFGLSNICSGDMAILPYNSNNIIIMRNHEVIPSKRGFPKTSHCSSKMKKVTDKIDEISLVFSSLENCIIKFHKVLIALCKLIMFIIKIILLFSSTL